MSFARQLKSKQLRKTVKCLTVRYVSFNMTRRILWNSGLLYFEYGKNIAGFLE